MKKKYCIGFLWPFCVCQSARDRISGELPVCDGQAGGAAAG